MKNIALIIGTFALALIGNAQLDRSVRPTAGEAPKINIGDYHTFTTDNGITVIVSENHKIPKISFDLVMGSDPMIEGNKAGLANFAGEMIMSGTNNRSKDVLDNEVDYIGATLNADQNSIFLSCLTKHLDKGLTLMSDIMMNANFPESEFTRIKSQNESNLLSTKSDAGSMAQNAVAKTVFPAGHPNHEVMTEITLGNITREDLISYYKQHFTPKGSYLVIVGDINKEKAKLLVDKYFSSWTGGAPVKREHQMVAKNTGNRVIFVKKPGAVQSVIQVAFPVNMMPGDVNQIPLSVSNQILGGGGFGSRMMQNLREDKAYTYGAYSRLNINEDGSYFSAGGNFRNEVTDSAITQLLYEIERIGEGEISLEELALTKSSMAGGFARSLESPQTVAKFALNQKKYKLDDDYYQDYLKNLSNINQEDVLTMSQQYFPAKNLNIIVVGNEEVLERLRKFDADGKIEMLDAFGDIIVETKKADITKEQLIEKYMMAVTNSSSMSEVGKKLKKLKTVNETMTLTSPQIPIALTLTKVYSTPNKASFKIEGQGMVMQREVFDGQKGSKADMQSGKKDLTAEELDQKKKSIGYFPEINYKTSGMTYELVGIEMLDGKEVYVVKTNDGKDEGYDYYDKTTFMKVKSTNISTKDGEVQEISQLYGDFKNVNGFNFPQKMTLIAGPMTFSGKTDTVVVNGKVDPATFQ